MHGIPIKPVRVDTSCCAGYKEFIFSGTTFPEAFTIINSTASNYVHGTIATNGLAELTVTFGTYSGYELSVLNTQVIGTTEFGTNIIPIYNSDNTVGIQWPEIGALTGAFTIKIYDAIVQPI